MTAKIKKIIQSAALFSLYIVAISGLVLAGTSTPCENGNAEDCLKNSTGFDKIYSTLTDILTFLAASVGLFATIMLVVGGIQYITSNGNPQAVTAAKKKIGNVLLGLIAFAFLYAFLEWLIPGRNFQ